MDFKFKDKDVDWAVQKIMSFQKINKKMKTKKEFKEDRK